MRLRIKKHGKNLQLKKTVVLLRRQSLKRSSFAGVVKLVDTLDLGSSASRRGGFESLHPHESLNSSVVN